MAKIVPSERLRRELDEVLAGVGEHDDPAEVVARVGARLIMHQALEDEVSEFSAATAISAPTVRTARSIATATRPGRSRRRAARWSSSVRAFAG